MISGKIYVVHSHHYLGMDGDYVENIAAYTTEKAAKNKVARLNKNESYKEEYDVLWFDYKEIELVC